MKIAVTGASGRVGSAVVELAVSQGHHVVAIDRAPDGMTAGVAAFRQIDMQSYGAVVEALDGCEALIHLAAINGPGRDADDVVHNNNVTSSYNALRAAAEVGIRRVSQASSVNAIGGRFSQTPKYDYFPLDEHHPAYVEDPYSLSKWICERQADAITDAHRDMSVASLRLHGVVDDIEQTRGWAEPALDFAWRQLWGYTLGEASARAFLAGVTVDFEGHEALYIVAPTTMVDTPSLELREKYYPDVSLRADLPANAGFYDCSRAEEILGWSHNEGGP
ncbi:MAG: NAD(P)-dependent oxidoreductase [Acidimicrobiia bacterium]|nr:NAD(P)-dependent oxidoreductase [Acidimicrobiia bacterium]NNC74960.1 NAD(P)-dependent oxidoreductase [Acidimicrobiia bacterium]